MGIGGYSATRLLDTAFVVTLRSRMQHPSAGTRQQEPQVLAAAAPCQTMRSHSLAPQRLRPQQQPVHSIQHGIGHIRGLCKAGQAWSEDLHCRTDQKLHGFQLVQPRPADLPSMGSKQADVMCQLVRQGWLACARGSRRGDHLREKGKGAARTSISRRACIPWACLAPPPWLLRPAPGRLPATQRRAPRESQPRRS